MNLKEELLDFLVVPFKKPKKGKERLTEVNNEWQSTQLRRAKKCSKQVQRQANTLKLKFAEKKYMQISRKLDLLSLTSKESNWKKRRT